MTTDTVPFRVGLAGLGTVGTAVVTLIRQNADLIAARAGRPIELAAICARAKGKSRACDTSGVPWLDDPLTLAAEPGIDAVVEVMGGAEGAAKTLAEACAAQARPLVTANKALLALHGFDLAKAFARRDTPIMAEAAVAGGIPIIKALGEGLAANSIDSVQGILNGTCNFILSFMRETGRDFASALAVAQEKGYAEADPSFDIDGVDAAQKLSILAAIAFGMPPVPAAVHTEGIRRISALDIHHADRLGYRIKLTGRALRTKHGIVQNVGPCLVPKTSILWGVEGATNAVTITGDAVGPVTLIGAGAGGSATASAIVADLIDLARGRPRPLFGVAPALLHPQPFAPLASLCCTYYVRLMAIGRTDTVADISTLLRDGAIAAPGSIQHGPAADGLTPLIFTTHETDRVALREMLERVEALKTVAPMPTVIRIESLA